MSLAKTSVHLETRCQTGVTTAHLTAVLGSVKWGAVRAPSPTAVLGSVQWDVGAVYVVYCALCYGDLFCFIPCWVCLSGLAPQFSFPPHTHGAALLQGEVPGQRRSTRGWWTQSCPLL